MSGDVVCIGRRDVAACASMHIHKTVIACGVAMPPFFFRFVRVVLPPDISAVSACACGCM